MTISFLANLINENDKYINGTLFSKGENNFNIDFTTEYGFMTFTSLSNNS